MKNKIKNYLKFKIIFLTYQIFPKFFYYSFFRSRLTKKFSKTNHPLLPLFNPDFSKRFFSIRPNFRKCFVKNILIRSSLESRENIEKAKKDNSVPLITLLISPTMRCNLRCKGCYALNYKKEDDLPYEAMDRVIEEAKEMGVLFFTILGGEPFLRQDLFDIYKKHSDAVFQIFTNGTLINEETVKKLIEADNVILQISVEGLENDTDERRGAGTFKKTMKAMDILRKNRIPFGYSACVTRKNAEVVVSDEFVDLMIDKGALIGWYFLYMPVCGDKNIDLMPTPEQRNHQRIRLDYIRTNKPIFVVDFWNDAPFVGGCIAAKYYCHINNFGDVEPCIFTHFSQANIKNTSLKEALNCQFFKEIRARQPYSPNLLMPCMLIDHPKVSRELYNLCKPYPTHSAAQILFEDLKDDLDKYSYNVHQIFDKIWEEDKNRKDKD